MAVITDDMGIASLGKYTFPIIAALAVNVVEVSVMHVAKKDHIALLHK